GSVICWENYMPLLRPAMYAKGVALYCAPTVDDRPTWTATMTHIALEGRTHVLSACQYITKDAYPDDHPFEVDLPYGGTAIRGGSIIVAPTGQLLASPVYDEETILYADIDPAAKTRTHLDFDVVGHYSRPDVFALPLHSEARNTVSFDSAPIASAGARVLDLTEPVAHGVLVHVQGTGSLGDVPGAIEAGRQRQSQIRASPFSCFIRFCPDALVTR